MDDGWIKIFRRFLRWEWYDDTNMVRLYLHLLLKANYEPKKWHGEVIGRGQLVTSIGSLANETGLTRQNIRTCLQRLIDTQEINKQVTNKYTIITICKYDSYQQGEESNQQATNKQLTSNQQATNKQLTSNQQQHKNIKKERKKEIHALSSVNARAREDHGRFIEWLSKECPYVAAHIEPPTPEQFAKLKDEYSSKEIASCCQQIENRTDLRRRYKNLYLALLNWLKRERARNNTANYGRQERETVEERNRRIIEETAAVIASRQAEDDRNS